MTTLTAHQEALLAAIKTSGVQTHIATRGPIAYAEGTLPTKIVFITSGRRGARPRCDDFEVLVLPFLVHPRALVPGYSYKVCKNFTMFVSELALRSGFKFVDRMHDETGAIVEEDACTDLKRIHDKVHRKFTDHYQEPKKAAAEAKKAAAEFDHMLGV